MYLLLFSTQISTKFPNTIAIDSANIKKAFKISAGAGKVDGQPFPLTQQELLERDGAVSTMPLVESNIVGACGSARFFWIRHLDHRCSTAVCSSFGFINSWWRSWVSTWSMHCRMLFFNGGFVVVFLISLLGTCNNNKNIVRLCGSWETPLAFQSSI